MKKILLLFFEVLLPILMVLLAILLLYQYPESSFIKSIICFMKEKISTISPLFFTLGTVIIAFTITSLSVLGTTATHSIVKISNNVNAVKRLMFLATLTLINSILLIVLSSFYELINIKIYLLVFVISIASLISYAVIIVIIFYNNIVNISQDKQSSETLLGEIRTIKKHINSTRASVEEINNKVKSRD